ncbi:MAG TPA: hypothetical protein EYQ00_08560 [Dehalococcoidia bacterium]|nr:hypothetical protein [Dehalococcoidia bacterium]
MTDEEKEEEWFKTVLSISDKFTDVLDADTNIKWWNIDMIDEPGETQLMVVFADHKPKHDEEAHLL